MVAHRLEKCEQGKAEGGNAAESVDEERIRLPRMNGMNGARQDGRFPAARNAAQQQRLIAVSCHVTET